MTTTTIPGIALAIFLFSTATVQAQVPLEAPITAIVVDSGNKDTLYAGTRAGVLKSTDAGATWLQTPILPPGGPQPPVTALLADPGRPGVVYVGTDTANQYLWRTTNGGATWQAISNGLSPDHDTRCNRIDLRPPFGAIYATVRGVSFQEEELWKSVDDGASWQRIAVSSKSMEVSWTDPNVIYRPGIGYRVERSTDEGKTWQLLSLTQDVPHSNTNGLNRVAVSPADPNVLVASSTGSIPSRNGFFRSADGGASWTKIITTNAFGVRADPSNKSQFFSQGCCGGLSVYISQDTGLTWEQISVVSFTERPATGLTFIARGSSYIFPTSTGIWTGTRSADVWTRIGTYSPTFSAMPFPVEATLLSRSTSEASTSIRVNALEDPALKVTGITVNSEETPWLSFSQSQSSPDRLFAKLSAQDAGPGDYQTTIRMSIPESPDELEVPVALTVTDEVRKPFVVLDNPLPNGVFAETFTNDPDGNLIYATSNQIFRVEPDGSTTRLAGNGDRGYKGDGGPALDAELSNVVHLASDSAGNLYFADKFRRVVRRIDLEGVISTVAGMTTGSTKPANGAVATEVRLRNLAGLAVNGPGVLHIAADDQIWKVTPAGTLQLYAGGGNVTTDNARAVLASLDGLSGIAFNSAGELYFSETEMDRLRAIGTGGLVRTIAGSGGEGYQGDGAAAINARLSEPGAITFDAAGQPYFVDQDGHVVRRVRSDGQIETVMGSGDPGRPGFCTAAETAPIDDLEVLHFTSNGWLFVNDGFRTYRLWIGETADGERPMLPEGAVVNAASFQATVAGGSLFSVFGERIAARQEQASGSWPHTLGGALVCLDEQALPLYYTSSGQINGQVFYGIEPGSHWLRAYSPTGGSNAVEVQVTEAAPGIFQYGDSHAVAVNPDGSVNSTSNPVDGGAFAVVYLTGIGPVDNPVATGGLALADPLSRPIGEAVITINGQPAGIIFLGLTPGFIGLAQANINIPDLPPGTYDLVITIGGVASAPVRLTVR